jgi:cell wall-associated NlpC family hydrolase
MWLELTSQKDQQQTSNSAIYKIADPVKILLTSFFFSCRRRCLFLYKNTLRSHREAFGLSRRRIFMKNWRIIFGAVFVILFFVSTNVFAAETYRVKKGDTLATISTKHRVSVDSLKQANKLKGNKVTVNQVLVIPNKAKSGSGSVKAAAPPSRVTSQSSRVASQSSRVTSQKATSHKKTYTVKKGDSLQKIARTTGVSVSELKSLNRISDNIIVPGQKLTLQRGSAVAAVKKPLPRRSNAGAQEEGDYDDTDAPVQAILDENENSSLPLGKWEDSKDRELLVKISKGFLGAPYRFGGVSLKGIDCSAYVKRVYSLFDVTLPRTAREQAKVGQRVSRDELTVGDLVFFNTRRNYISHVGIYIGEGQFIHASSGRGKEVKINNLSELYYNKRYVGATRLKGWEDKL